MKIIKNLKQWNKYATKPKSFPSYFPVIAYLFFEKSTSEEYTIYRSIPKKYIKSKKKIKIYTKGFKDGLFDV